MIPINTKKIKKKLQNYTPHLCLLLCLFTLIVSIFIIDGQGFTPQDDCLRHCGKILSGKTWNEILILRPEYTSDHNYGWHKTLELFHKTTDATAQTLISFSIIFLFLCATVPLLFIFKRPEAWLASILLFGLLYFGNFYRFFYGRPYIFAIGGTLLILHLWTNLELSKKVVGNQKKRVILPPFPLLIFTPILFALMTYIHGSFYLYILPVGAFLLARRWREFTWLSLCLFIGIILGLLLTGDPIGHLKTHLYIFSMFSKFPLEARYLVTEFWPNPAATATITTTALFLIIRYLQEKKLNILDDPIFILFVGMGILGFRNGRFWLDFGVPAMVLWNARECCRIFSRQLKEDNPQRIILTATLCVTFFITITANIGDRWDNNYEGCGRIFPKEEDPLLKGCFPDPGGVFYCTSMGFFYNTFSANPQGHWRYILGFEANLMPDEDLQVYRAIEKENKWKAFDPWVQKMRQKDRLVIYHSTVPEIEGLEWTNAFKYMWFGKIPSDKSENVTDPFLLQETPITTKPISQDGLAPPTK